MLKRIRYPGKQPGIKPSCVSFETLAEKYGGVSIDLIFIYIFQVRNNCFGLRKFPQFFKAGNANRTL